MCKTTSGPNIRDTNINDIPYSYSGSFSAVSKPNFTSKQKKTFDEIYKIYTLLRRSEFNNSSKVRQTFSHVCNCIFKSSPRCCNCCRNFSNVDYFNFRKFNNFTQKTKDPTIPKAAWRRVAVTPPGRPTRRPGDATAYMTLTPWIPSQRGARVLPLHI